MSVGTNSKYKNHLHLQYWAQTHLHTHVLSLALTFRERRPVVCALITEGIELILLLHKQDFVTVHLNFFHSGRE